MTYQVFLREMEMETRWRVEQRFGRGREQLLEKMREKKRKKGEREKAWKKKP